ncbi:CDP-alcohol phosphatidyltransferase family protein [Nocardia cyriacigeorgica]|uniref:Phosphatidylinositol phosphate synthase n=2 Tax=Nocardia cyriacigeorgica TaxID=135487 RepID=H6R284_NOCCG|nr:CDP-alcohol phosphatidyltransferase family protein [Nocardia cyriacigeorgica]MBF6080792.1 CDP-alcohol phosphatidyltransferase family protein [Nocardia cyriacigeorgica]MBF6284674.1 CDP-alcohol phosphatidyltransferase family protein [Nocardia cyriacigeorgica]MBF6423627.1 CDP-alcohol phosphatidyltransferase family protein [Nocardia cyriacigeorgica]NEW33985.1 CDP-alcohol phosphatidyltransferase family protein [Nocardia cyriacigeorgica]CCF64372.1 putative phosphatidylinositol synthase [Nocardia 
MLSIFGRATFAKATAPLGKALVRTGLTPDAMTLIGTAASIIAAMTLFPSGHLFWGTMVIWLFVMFDMLDGAMARARGGGTKYGAVLDATCDRVADGAIFGGLAWWAVYHENSKPLLFATLVVLVTSQVISYAKARAEASGLSADGGLIERPDRLVIVLVGAGFTGIGGYWGIEWLTWAVHVAMWILAVLSIVTVLQRVLAVRNSAGARDIIPMTPPQTENTTDPERRS